MIAASFLHRHAINNADAIIPLNALTCWPFSRAVTVHRRLILSSKSRQPDTDLPAQIRPATTGGTFDSSLRFFYFAIDSRGCSAEQAVFDGSGREHVVQIYGRVC